MQERGAEEPFDGIIEFWLESAADLQNLNNAEADALRAEMEAYQQQFVDFTESRRFFTEWEPVPGLG